MPGRSEEKMVLSDDQQRCSCGSKKAGAPDGPFRPQNRTTEGARLLFDGRKERKKDRMEGKTEGGGVKGGRREGGRERTVGWWEDAAAHFTLLFLAGPRKSCRIVDAKPEASSKAPFSASHFTV